MRSVNQLSRSRQRRYRVILPFSLGYLDFKVHSVAWSCDGRRLASGSFDKCVSIYSLDKYGLVGRKNDYVGVIDGYEVQIL